MATDIKVPQLGESVVEATVGRWLKREGDAVKAGETLVELETDKVNLEVSADQAGVLERIARREGETVQIGDVLGSLAGADGGQPTADDRPQTADSGRPTTDDRPQTVNGGQPAAPAQSPVSNLQSPALSPQPSAPSSEDVRATPVARRVAADKGVDLAQVPPTGLAGRATKDDVVRFAEGQGEKEAGRQEDRKTGEEREAVTPPAAPAPAQSPISNLQSPASSRPEERVRMTRRRQTIARRLVEATQTTAMLTTFNEIDMTAVMDLRKKRRESFEKRHGVRLGFMSFFTKASIGALKAFPQLNAEIQGDEIVLKRYFDIGIAVGAEGGLVVPVVRNADRLTFAEIEKGIEALAKKAQSNTLSIEDLQGGTFTITNGGVFGSLLSTPILNPPQVGILGLHKIEERPIAKEGQVVIRPMMYVALSYDHRIVDGREAVQFLVRIKELIEDPETLLLEG